MSNQSKTLEYKVTIECEVCPYIETHGDSYATEQEAEIICEQMESLHLFNNYCLHGVAYVWPRLKRSE